MSVSTQIEPPKLDIRVETGGPLPFDGLPISTLSNFRVKVFAYGRYPRGTIIPFSIANAEDNVAYQVRDRVLEPTLEPISDIALEQEGRMMVDRNAASNFIQLQQAQRQLHAVQLRNNELEAAVKAEKDKGDHFGRKLVEAEGEAARLNTVLSNMPGGASAGNIQQLLRENNRLQDELEAKTAALAQRQHDLQQQQAELDKIAAANAAVIPLVPEPKEPLPEDDPDRPIPR